MVQVPYKLTKRSSLTTEEIIHTSGLGGVVVALAAHGKTEELAQLVAHLQHFRALLVSAADGPVVLPPAMSEPDLSTPRPASELAALLGIRPQSLLEACKRAGGGQRGIKRVEALVPGSNARYLYYVERPDKALEMRAQQLAQVEQEPAP